MRSPVSKKCPSCGLEQPLMMQACSKCGHIFRTQFGPPIDQTQMIAAHGPSTPTVDPTPDPPKVSTAASQADPPASNLAELLKIEATPKMVLIFYCAIGIMVFVTFLAIMVMLVRISTIS